MFDIQGFVLKPGENELWIKLSASCVRFKSGHQINQSSTDQVVSCVINLIRNFGNACLSCGPFAKLAC